MFLVSVPMFLSAREYQDKDAQKIDKDARRVFMVDETQIPRRIYFKEDASVSRLNFFQRYSANLVNDQIIEVQSFTDNLGMTHTRYQQFHKGLKVIGGEYILHEKNGKVVSANGYLQSDLDMDIQPQLSEREAFQLALNRVGGSLYKWETEPELFSEPVG
ncbi:MAG: hypothetical protein D6732_25010, partial [Methanobacteriota archaeon]